jgi:hypothetical protein
VPAPVDVGHDLVGLPADVSEVLDAEALEAADDAAEAGAGVRGRRQQRGVMGRF